MRTTEHPDSLPPLRACGLGSVGTGVGGKCTGELDR